MTRVRPTQLVFGILALLLASGCNPRPNPTAPNWTFFPGPDTGSMLGDDGMSFLVGDKNKRGGGGTGGGGGVGVNAFLWRGALDTLGFMPLSSADPFGGVIITDWYTPQSVAGERFKATAYILSKELRSDGVKVAIFRQVLDRGQWVDAPVAAGTVAEIENKVLDRARRLREQGQTTG